MNIVIKSLAFEGPRTGPDRGFSIKAHYLTEPEGGALVEITRDGEPYRSFLYPAYKIWNLAAHFTDIVDSEVAGDFHTGQQQCDHIIGLFMCSHPEYGEMDRLARESEGLAVDERFVYCPSCGAKLPAQIHQ